MPIILRQKIDDALWRVDIHQKRLATFFMNNAIFQTDFYVLHENRTLFLKNPSICTLCPIPCTKIKFAKETVIGYINV